MVMEAADFAHAWMVRLSCLRHAASSQHTTCNVLSTSIEENLARNCGRGGGAAECQTVNFKVRGLHPFTSLAWLQRRVQECAAFAQTYITHVCESTFP